MKVKIFSFAFFLLFVYGCSKESNPTKSENTFTYELAFQFNTFEKPNSMVMDNENQFIYISSGYLNSPDDSPKIQKFNFTGELLATVVDFLNYSNGLFSGYSPLDITLDDEQNICVLARPYKKSQNDEYWEPYNGFCILVYNSNGNFQKEFDYSEIDFFYTPSITFKNNWFFVTNSFTLYKISKTSEQLTEIPLPKSSDGSMPENFISDLAVNGDENIWFVGQASEDGFTVGSYISKVDSKCSQIFKFYSIRTTGNFGANLSQPSIELNKNGNIYLTTFYCQSLEIYNSSGILLRDYDFNKEINKNTLPIDLGIDKAENIYVLDGRNDLVYVLKKA